MEKYTNEELKEIKSIIKNNFYKCIDRLMKFVDDEELIQTVRELQTKQELSDEEIEMYERFAIKVFERVPEEKMPELINSMDASWVYFLFDDDVDFYEMYPSIYFSGIDIATVELDNFEEQKEEIKSYLDLNRLTENPLALKNLAGLVKLSDGQNVFNEYMHEVLEKLDKSTRIQLFEDGIKYYMEQCLTYRYKRNSYDDMSKFYNMFNQLFLMLPEEEKKEFSTRFAESFEKNGYYYLNENKDLLNKLYEYLDEDHQVQYAKGAMSSIQRKLSDSKIDFEMLDSFYFTKYDQIHDVLGRLSVEQMTELCKNDDVCQYIFEQIFYTTPFEGGAIYSTIAKFSPELSEKYIIYMKNHIGELVFSLPGQSKKLDVILRFIDNSSNEAIKRNTNLLLSMVKEIQGELDLVTSIMQGEKIRNIINQVEMTMKNADSSIGIDDNIAKISLFECFQNQAMYARKVGLMLDDNPEAQVDSDFISTLEQLAKHNTTLKDVYEQIKKNMAKFKVPDMSKYEVNVESFTNMDEATFADFMSNLKTYKLAEGIIPEQYCDYLIKLKLDPESPLSQNLDTYYIMFKRAFEDKGRHLLEQDGIKDCCVSVTSKLEENNLGKNGITFIEIKEENLRDLSFEHIDVLDTLYHEVKHADQRERVYKDKNIKDSKDYLMLKEHIIMQEKPGFYEANYTFMQAEIDARIAGRRGAVQLLKKIGYGDRPAYDYNGNDINSNYNQLQLDEQKLYKYARYKILEKKDEQPKVDDFKLVNEIFSSILAEKATKAGMSIGKTELEELYERYPTFQYEFDENGVARPAADVLEIFEKHYNDAKNGAYRSSEKTPDLAILGWILRNPTLSRKNLFVNTLKLSTYTPNNPVMKQNRDLIFEDQVIPLLKFYLENGYVPKILNNETPEETRTNCEAVDTAIESYINSNDPDIAKKMVALKEKYRGKTEEEIKKLAVIDGEVSPEDRAEADAHVVSKVAEEKRHEMTIKRNDPDEQSV